MRGIQCFMIPVSYQTVSISGSPEEIIEEARRAYALPGTPTGGFIGYVEEYSCMGMSEKRTTRPAARRSADCSAGRRSRIPGTH